MRLWICSAVAALLVVNDAHAASKIVQYGPAPAWVKPPPAPSDTPTPEGAAFRFVDMDSQAHLGPSGQESYSAYRVKVLKPEALSAGNIVATWNPATDDVIVHRLRILRGGRSTDVLATTKFRVIERENNLAYAMLDGELTATLQVPGLQVGDELDFAMTLRRRETTLGDKANGFMQLPAFSSPGAFRVRLTWPRSMALRWQATKDLTGVSVQDAGAERILEYQLRDPKSVIPTDGAPERYNLARVVQFTEFQTWGELAGLMGPLFEHAEVLAPNSPLHAEAAKIAAATTDPRARAEQALRLVQDHVRYVYVGLNGGNYRPATADETWERRFGDCKAKTVLLIALLKELGVPAEAVLVNTLGGDGTDERLPSPQVFNHVLVRTNIGGKSFWLDGTRLDGGRMEGVATPFRWALPLRDGAQLEAVKPEAPVFPQEHLVLDIDARAGVKAPAKVHAEQVFRGDEIPALKSRLSELSAEDAQRALKAYWRGTESWVEPDVVTWRYDAAADAVIFNMAGEGKPAWDGDEQKGYSHDIEGAGFAPPDELKRPKEQDQTIPWKTNFPRYRRWTTVIHLPDPGPKWRWTYKAAPVDEKFGGVSYWREAQLRDGVLAISMSRRTYLPEITAAQAKEIGERLPKFDNNISQVWQYPAAEDKPEKAVTARSLLDSIGKDAPRLVEAALLLAEDKRYDDAIKLYDRALAIDPKLRRALYGKVQAYISKGDAAGGMRLLQEASRGSTDPELAIARAHFLIRTDHNNEGLAELETIAPALKADPQLARTALVQFLDAHAYERAVAVASDAIAKKPDDSYLWSMRAEANDHLKRYAAAVSDMDEAIRLDPEDDRSFAYRGVVLQKLGQDDKAEADFEEVVRIAPLDTSILSARVHALRKIGRSKEADALYDAWLDRDKTGRALNARCWDRAIVNHELIGAEADCAEALKLQPKAAAFWDSFALVAFRNGKMAEAVKRYDRAIELAPKQAPSLYGRGIAKRRLGDVAAGDADIAAAKALNPDAGAELAQAGILP